MKQSNIQKLERYRYVLETRSFTPTSEHRLSDILEVIHEEFNPNYKVDMFCPHCVMVMVQYAFSEMEKRKTDIINIKF